MNEDIPFSFLEKFLFHNFFFFHKKYRTLFYEANYIIDTRICKDMCQIFFTYFVISLFDLNIQFQHIYNDCGFGISEHYEEAKKPGAGDP